MGLVLMSTGHVVAALRNKGERYRSFVHREQLGDEYLKL
jgi:hypothetical protein